MAGSDKRDVERGDAENLWRNDKPRVNWKPVIGLVVIVALTVFGLVYAQLLGSQVARLVRWSKRLGPWAAVLMFACSALLPVIMLPVFPLMALSGPLFTEMFNCWLLGGTVAFGSVFGGLWCGSVIAFALGKNVFKSYSEKTNAESTTMKRINRLVNECGVKIVLMARASPMMPAEIFDYACSITTLSTCQYAVGCLGSAVPVAFWTFSSAQAAAAAHDGAPGEKIGLIVINVIALVALTVLLICMIGRSEAALMAKSDPIIRSISQALPPSAHDEEPLQEQLLRPTL